MTQNAWEQTLWILTGKRVDVSVAQGIRKNFDANFASARRGHFDLFDFQLICSPSDSSLTNNVLSS